MRSIDLSVAELVDLVRAEGSDLADVEVKTAYGGYPTDLAPTLSAFGNQPGGGVILLGLDERRGFDVVGVYDAVAAQTALGAQARSAIEPPLSVQFETARIDGAIVIAARVRELAPIDKPCLVTATGQAYLRSFDGDYRLSPQEIQAVVANRGRPRFDLEPVPDARREDLDPALVSIYLATTRTRSPRIAGMTDDEALVATRVLTTAGEITLAGLYTLGRYPQQYLPTLSITARVAPRPGDPPGTRGSDITHFDGPLPELMEQSVSWVRRNTSTRVRFGVDGHGRDEPDYPTEAVRELVSNALVHRDLGPHALGSRVNLVLEEDRLIVANPGGLFGLTREQLGLGSGGSARNQSLYDICKDVRTSDGRRVIEGAGTGIAAVRDSLRRASMTEPRFFDNGVRFAAIIPEHALLDPGDLQWLATLEGIERLSDTQRHVLASMRHGTTWTNRTLRDRFPMDSTEARSTLADLVARGLAEGVGDRGQRHYRLSSYSAVPVRERPTPLWEENLDSPRATPRDRNDPATASTTASPPAPARIAPRARVTAALGAGASTSRDLTRRTSLSTRQVIYALARLMEDGEVVRNGGPGMRRTTYRLVEQPRA